MITIKEIAEKAGVSAGTVDRALHNRGRVKKETKEKILAVAKEYNYKPNEVAQGLVVRKKKLKLCFLSANPETNPFFRDVRDAAEKKAEELTLYGVTVDFYTVRINEKKEFDIDGNLEEHLGEYDGLVTIGIPSAQIERCLDYMEKESRPVVFYNEMMENRNYLAYVGCDYIASGRLAAGLCVLAGNTDAKVCVYSQGMYDVLSFSARMKGLEQEREARYPDLKILDCFSVSLDQRENTLMAEEMFRRYPDVNIVYVVNPGDYGICDAVHRADAKHQVKIITNDMVEPEIEMMEQGIVSATICQEPEKQGAQPLDILFRYLAFGTEPEKRICYTNLSIHIAQNVY